MPPKLKLLPPKPSYKPPEGHGDASDRDVLTIGNVLVGPSGVQFTGEGDFHVPLPDLNVDTLRRVSQLGKGAQGSVSMYESIPDHKQYAIKKMTIPSTADQRMRQTVAAELRNIFSEKSNPYSVQLYNAFYRDGTLRLVMEYMDWGNMEELLAQGVKLPEEVCAYLACEMLRALDILHTKASIVTEGNSHKSMRQIHRDIKPANVLLSVDGTVKLADFGIATSAETIGVNSFVGTATYMSPERIQGKRYSTPSDIWSVGLVVAQTLLGRYPFAESVKSGFMALLREITTVKSFPLRDATHCSQEAQDFIDGCLKQNPEERLTATELLQTPWITKNEEKGKQMLVQLLSSMPTVNHSDVSSPTTAVPPLMSATPAASPGVSQETAQPAHPAHTMNVL